MSEAASSQETLRLTDDGIEIPDGVDLSDGVVFRARGATVDHKPGAPDQPFYPAVDERHLTAEDRRVVNEQLDEFEISIKPYGEEAEVYQVAVPATDGGREKRSVRVGQVETHIYPDDTVVDLFNRTEGPLEVTPENTVLCRPFSDDIRTSPPDEEDHISFDLDEVEDGDVLELYRLPVSERPAYDEALRADGGREQAFPGDDLWPDYRTADIAIGDVVVDLSRGVSLQVVKLSTQRAGEHPDVRSDPTAEMFDVADSDLVFDCVFLPDGEGAVSPPSKTYSYAESRLLRYPVEDATPNARLQREWLTNVLEDLAVEANELSSQHLICVREVVSNAFGSEVAGLLEEFAESAGGETA